MTIKLTVNTQLSACVISLIFATLVVFPAFSAQQSKRSVINIGYYSLPPHAMHLDDQARGAAVDYLQQQIFNNDKYQIHWQYHPFARVLAELQSERLDAALLIAKTPQREARFRYPQSHLYQTQSGLIPLKQHPLKNITTLSQLQGMTLGHVIDSVRPEVFKSLDITFEDISGRDFTNRNIRKLATKRIDAVYVPTLSHARYQLQDSHQHGLNFIPLPQLGHKLYLVFRKGIADDVIQQFEKNNAVSAASYLTYLRRYQSSDSAYD